MGILNCKWNSEADSWTALSARDSTLARYGHRCEIFSRLGGLLIPVSFNRSAVGLTSRRDVILAPRIRGAIVIDKIARFLAAKFIASTGRITRALAFVLFCVFDIVKVFPASKL